MIIRIFILIIFSSAFVFKANAEPLYMVKCLQDLALAIKLDFPDNMETNREYDSEWEYKGKPLRVRTNSLGDISHIGYKLFDSDFANGFYARPLLDFIERYALEVEADILGEDKSEKESRRNVKFLEGNANMLSNLTPEVSVFINEQERRSFSVEWEANGNKVSMIIPASYQTLIGANAVELEQVLRRDVARLPRQLLPNELPDDWKDRKLSVSGDLAIVDYGNYLSDNIRSEIYIERKGDKNVIVIDLSKPVQSVKNILLTGYFNKLIELDLKLDMYGYKKSNLMISLQQMIEYFRNEGCKLYIGIKSYNEKTVEATLFAVNMSMAYNHTMSVSFPLSLIKDGKGVIKGTLYAYTPLQNITEKFFNY